tara:strand:- start:358 stop:585 length:228 start_codon:yes stop_codon:yes gene_type:complete
MNHDEPVLPVDINRRVFVGNFPEQAFVVTAVFGFIYTKGEIIATISGEAFFTLVGVISFTICVRHETILTGSGNN